MGGVKKLALVAVVAAAGWVSQAQAAMMTETPFVGYHSYNSRWSHTAGSNRGHITWRGDQPEWSAVNIAWVAAHTAPDFTAMPNSDPTSFESFVASPIPPWKQELVLGSVVPEPTMALAAFGMGVLALRRRKA